MPNKQDGDSIRRIKLEQLQVGMYVTEFSDQRAIEAGLKAKGLITRQETLARFRRLEVSHVYIDVVKGNDCEGSESVKALNRQQEEELKRVAIEQVCAPKVKFDEDREEDWVNCDLPPYLHMEIVMRAVQIYLASIGATSNGADKQS